MISIRVFNNRPAKSFKLRAQVAQWQNLIHVTVYLTTIVIHGGNKIVNFIGGSVHHCFPNLAFFNLAVAQVLLTAADLVSRILPSEQELKLGVVTALVGAPLFALVAWRASRSWRS